MAVILNSVWRTKDHGPNENFTGFEVKSNSVKCAQSQIKLDFKDPFFSLIFSVNFSRVKQASTLYKTSMREKESFHYPLVNAFFGAFFLYVYLNIYTNMQKLYTNTYITLLK